MWPPRFPRQSWRPNIFNSTAFAKLLAIWSWYLNFFSATATFRPLLKHPIERHRNTVALPYYGLLSTILYRQHCQKKKMLRLIGRFCKRRGKIYSNDKSPFRSKSCRVNPIMSCQYQSCQLPVECRDFLFVLSNHVRRQKASPFLLISVRSRDIIIFCTQQDWVGSLFNIAPRSCKWRQFFLKSMAKYCPLI